MQTTVLLSIKPEYANRILSGSKRFEFRRVIFREKTVSKVIIYSSSPVQRVVGEFTIGKILALGREELWSKTREYSGIQKSHFDQYFHGCEMAFAIEVLSPRRYSRPRKLADATNFTLPPQSFRYLDNPRQSKK
jgi:predicted transcriptional regulator